MNKFIVTTNYVTFLTIGIILNIYVVNVILVFAFSDN